MILELWTAFLLGFAGSLHCAGMCGPLVLALPAVGRSTSTWILGRLIYNAGRLVTYGLLGLVFGLIGKTLAVVGLQRWVCLAAGAAILIGLVISSRFALPRPTTRFVTWLKSSLGRLLSRRTLTSLFCFGGLNGLLPCGLVYVACAGAAASGGFLSSIEYMLVFGLGTVPMMVGLGLVGRVVPSGLRLKFQKVIPVCLALVGFLLIFRGLSLGIPYLSPDLAGQHGSGCTCH
jgi:sulfite exporter TauE/SafE